MLGQPPETAWISWEFSRPISCTTVSFTVPSPGSSAKLARASPSAVSSGRIW